MHEKRIHFVHIYYNPAFFRICIACEEIVAAGRHAEVVLLFRDVDVGI